MGLWHRTLAVCFRESQAFALQSGLQNALGNSGGEVKPTGDDTGERQRDGEVKEKEDRKEGVCLISCQCEYSVIGKKGRQMI